MRWLPITFTVLTLAASGCGSRALTGGDSGVPPSDSSGSEGIVSTGDGPAGGCTTNAQCGPGAYCHIESGCAVTGAIMGVCQPRPDSCDTLYAPVCGCDGQTYGNACGAHGAGVNVAGQGECSGECGLYRFLPSCPEDEICNITSCAATTGTCVEKPDASDCGFEVGPPVCGCNNKTYDSNCERLLAGVALKHPGACSKSTIAIFTDKTVYNAGDPVAVTLQNGSWGSIFLEGCSAFSHERMEQGLWVDKGPFAICGWEGVAQEVPGGGTFSDQVSFQPGGTYRIKAGYGEACAPGKPLSDPSCGALHTVFSDPFQVLPTQKTCLDVMDAYSAAMAQAKSCNPALSIPQCTELVLMTISCGCETYVNDSSSLEALTRAFEDQLCLKVNLPVCPPVACDQPQGSVCIDGLCADLAR